MNTGRFYIDGAWVDPSGSSEIQVVNPATEKVVATIAAGTRQDVDAAVAAAKRAFQTFRFTSVEERVALLERILENYKKRAEDIAQAVSQEMGAPIKFARGPQLGSGRIHIEVAIEALKNFQFTKKQGTTTIVREPIGVAALITPWNWPLNQINTKVIPALAAGCTMVLKPSEVAPLSALVFAEVLEESGVPAGVFNLVNGTGPEVGQSLATHPDVAVVSLTGSTRAGAAVSKAAADTVKRVTLELGGKSPNLIFADTDLAQEMTDAIGHMFTNAGQSCDAPSRLLVPREIEDQVIALAREVLAKSKVGSPTDETTTIGPVVNKTQFDKIQDLIASGIQEGAELLGGGIGRPEGFETGYYVKPTIFARVDPNMRISREEIFGPVMTINAFDDEEQAIRLANDTIYGLAAYISTKDMDRARRIAARLEAGMVSINNPKWDARAPFGGYKQSGNGREYGVYGIEEYLETKAIVGYGD